MRRRQPGDPAGEASPNRPDADPDHTVAKVSCGRRRCQLVLTEDKTFVLKAGDSLLAPRNISHQLRNSGSTANHYLLVFSPSGFEGFVMATAIPAPDNAVAPTERQIQVDDPSIAVLNVHRLAKEFGIIFG